MIEPGWIGLVGAAAFGALIGWYVYYINRYRKSDVQFSDLTTVIGILGGAAVLNLFPSQTSLFGAYGIGLFVGFFGYFASLLLLIRLLHPRRFRAPSDAASAGFPRRRQP
jgi:hypothetical protein